MSLGLLGEAVRRAAGSPADAADPAPCEAESSSSKSSRLAHAGPDDDAVRTRSADRDQRLLRVREDVQINRVVAPDQAPDRVWS